MSDHLLQHQKLVNASGLLACLIVVARTSFLGVAEPWPWVAEAGEVAYDLGLAWVTAWAFQLLVVVVPSERQRRRFNALIAPRLDHLIDLGMQLSDAMAAQARQKPGPLVDARTIESVCQGVSLADDVPGWAADWGSVLRDLSSRSAQVRASLRPFYPNLPSELLEALEAEDQAMDQLVRMARFGHAFDAPNMKRLETPIFRWLTSIQMVREIRANHVAPERPLPARSALEAGMVRMPLEDLIKGREDLDGPTRPL